MAPKRTQVAPPPSAQATTVASSTSGSSTPLPSKKSNNNQSAQEIAVSIWQNYLDTTPQRTKLIDIFMAFLVLVGGIQFLYCVIAGNYVSWRCKRLNAWTFDKVDTYANSFCSPSTLSSVDFPLRLVNSSWLQVWEFRQIQRISCSSTKCLRKGTASHHQLDMNLLLILYRAFADYVFGSLILHFFCVNFINWAGRMAGVRVDCTIEKGMIKIGINGSEYAVCFSWLVVWKIYDVAIGSRNICIPTCPRILWTMGNNMKNIFDPLN